MNKLKLTFLLTLAALLLSLVFFRPVGLAEASPLLAAAQTAGTQICPDEPVQGQFRILACDDFRKGRRGAWTASNRVTGQNLVNGRIVLPNRHEDAKPGAEPTTQLVYHLGNQRGDIIVEVKFDEFAPNENTRFMIDLQASPGHALDMGIWRHDGRQYLKFEVIAEGQAKVSETVEFNQNSGVMKVHYVQQTAQLRGFYKERPEDAYREIPGSPFMLPAFQKGPYIAVLYSHNFAPGGASSVELDWVKITTPMASAAALAPEGVTRRTGPAGAEGRPAGARNQPVRPENFQPFHFRYSVEDLREKYSEPLMKRAAELMARVNKVNQTGPYRPTIDSINSHAVPEWFEDAKFGMFVDWGLFSVPAYAPSGYPDWYLHRMIYGDTKEYHEEFWGPDFRRDDFIPLFTAAEYDPELIVKSAQEAGMRYIIPFAKHHDGYTLWPSSYTFRNAGEMGAKRDLIKPLFDAAKQRGLKTGFYFSIDEWEYPVIAEDRRLKVRLWDAEPRFEINYVPYDAEQFDGMISGKIPVRDFYNDFINPQAIEFIDKYDPDILWFDGDWVADLFTRNSKSIVAYFYNRNHGRKEVAMNDRLGLTRSVPTAGQLPTDPIVGDFFTSENLYTEGAEPGFRRKWEECSGLSDSFGYNWRETDEHVRSAEQVLHMLIDIVSGGGNLLLITNLTGEGKLDPLLVERLQKVGEWLKVNGEAIYATRAWKQFREGDDIRFTRSKDGKHVYAIALRRPQKNVTLTAVRAKPGSQIKMLGSEQPLRWRQTGQQLVIDVPAALLDKNPAGGWAFRIEQAGD